MMQIDFSDFMLTKIDRQVPLLGGGSQSDWVTAQSFGYPKHMTAIEKLPFGLDLTDDILRGILDGWKPLRERPRTGLIATRWGGQAQGFVGALEIVEIAKAIKVFLAVAQVAKLPPVQQLDPERAMEALILALGLRMIGTRMTHPHPQAQQPYGERGEGMLGIAAPGRPVVHRHPIGQPIAPKGLGQARLHGRALLVGTGVKQDIKARMVGSGLLPKQTIP